MTLQGDFLPDLLTIYSLNLLASRRVLISPIDTFIVSILTQIERRVTSNTWIKTFIRRSHYLPRWHQVLLMIDCAFYEVIFQDLSNFALLIEHEVTRNNTLANKHLFSL